MPTVMNVADYFLAALAANEESDITNIKLQKLCSYAQGISLGLLGNELFSDKIEAWRYGPVIPSLYEMYKEYDRKPIPENGMLEKYAREKFTDEQKFILELVKNYYGIIAPAELSKRSHRDFPGNFGSKEEIPIKDIEARFKDDPLVVKIKEQVSPAPYNANVDKLVSESEIWDALAV